MSAVRLQADPVHVRLFDLVGQDSETVPEFVRHVALAAEERATHTPTDSLRLTHMGPPLGVAEEGGQIQVHGTLPLTDDERLQVNVFVDEHRQEYETQKVGPLSQYCIRPHTDVYRRQDGDSTVQFRLFSCAGFVIEAYRDAGIDLLITDETQLPWVALDTVCQAYPDSAERLRNPALRTRRNLPGDGPWQLVLVGYVFNALFNRSREEIIAGPYQPVPGDEFFPPRHE